MTISHGFLFCQLAHLLSISNNHIKNNYLQSKRLHVIYIKHSFYQVIKVVFTVQSVLCDNLTDLFK